MVRPFCIGLLLTWSTPIGAIDPLPVSLSLPPAAHPSQDDASVATGLDFSERLTVPVTIDGHGPFEFVVDTGAERTVVANELAAKLGLEQMGPVTLQSIVGRTEVQTVRVPSLGILPDEYDTIRAPSLALHDLGAWGLLGTDNLQSRRVTFDLEAGRILISKGIKDSPSPDNEIVVRARRRSGQLIMADADANGVHVQVVIDTGAQVSIANAVLGRMLRKKRDCDCKSEVVTVTGERRVFDVGTLENLRLGPMSFAGMPIAFADAEIFRRLKLDKKPALLLGMDAVRTFARVSIDFESKKVAFLMRSKFKPARRTAALTKASVPPE
jgi:predicted aspartyl protease